MLTYQSHPQSARARTMWSLPLNQMMETTAPDYVFEEIIHHLQTAKVSPQHFNGHFEAVLKN